jgi:hypothetical protein
MAWSMTCGKSVTSDGRAMNRNKSVPCPFCKAAVGETCVNEDGTAFKTGIHMARWYALQKTQQEEAS